MLSVSGWLRLTDGEVLLHAVVAAGLILSEPMPVTQPSPDTSRLYVIDVTAAGF